ncbi:hypothetical protein MEQU1_002596 [Malassezia equina]|uniref:Glycoside hydrolase family 5 domain-containing protein n=1 Tax=Malassezia equina TaxID=1381935 RepID=A0AAF0IZT3_9BASI|nr:hypothetical protein MEQU1_002596 [Malassezia equina]
MHRPFEELMGVSRRVVALLLLTLGVVTSSHASQDGLWLNPFDGQAKTVGNNCTVLPDYWPKSSLDVWFPPYDSEKAEMMRYRFQSGVNLGSWFVTEKWMAPSLFQCVHEGEKGELAILHGYGNTSQGIQSARALLEKHWDTWITVDDFDKMRYQYNINSVRIPIGYWNLPGAQFTKDTPFEAWSDVYKNSWKYVRRAIEMAADRDMGVLLDLHAAYGSQNGQENSGYNGFRVEFFWPENQKRTKEALVWIANDLKDVTNLVGIELLNEPWNEPGLGGWFESTAKAIHDIGGNAAQLPVYYSHPATPQNSSSAKNKPTFTAYDTHQYYTFVDRNAPVSDILDKVQGSVHEKLVALQKATGDRLVVGEWSCALDPGSLSGNAKEHAKQRLEFCQRQIESYRNASSAMYFWSYKYEDCKFWGGWCFDDMYRKYIGSYDGYGLSLSESKQVFTQMSMFPTPMNAIMVPPWSSSHSKAQGFKDGFDIAKKLATTHPISRLGFKGEFIRIMWGRRSKHNAGLDLDDYSQGFEDGALDVSQAEPGKAVNKEALS